jgi:hypothetical protein
MSCRRGAVSVEAAILWPVMIALVIGTIEFALLLFTYSSMQAAARDVARQLALNFATPAQAAAEVAARMPRWTDGGSVVEVTQSAPGDPATNVIRLSVTLPAVEATPVRLFTHAADAVELRAQVTMKQELPL